MLKDGSESYAYHIPGRREQQLDYNPADYAPCSATEQGCIREGDFINEFQDNNYHRDSYGFHPGEWEKYNRNARICEIADTTDHIKNTGAENAENGPAELWLYNGYRPRTSFWENLNEKYPNTPDFNVVRKVNADGSVSVVAGNELAGDKVRHHKMPSNHSKEGVGYIEEASVKDNYIEEQVTVNVSGSPGFGQTNSNPLQSEPMKAIEQVVLMGIKLDNIQIPKHILDNVQGYKIYYAKRKPEDKTILGQSIAIPAHPKFASVPEQSVVQAKKGPYYRGWYLYGGLRSDDRAGIEVSPLWRTRNKAHTYVASPVFTFHDFGMLRRKADLSSATHISVQYGVVFRHFLGGPGQFIPPCRYNKLKFAHDKDGANYAYLYNNIEDASRSALFYHRLDGFLLSLEIHCHLQSRMVL